jgi:hypothetical protein
MFVGRGQGAVTRMLKGRMAKPARTTRTVKMVKMAKMAIRIYLTDLLVLFMDRK